MLFRISIQHQFIDIKVWRDFNIDYYQGDIKTSVVDHWSNLYYHNIQQIPLGFYEGKLTLLPEQITNNQSEEKRLYICKNITNTTINGEEAPRQQIEKEVIYIEQIPR